MKRTCVNINLPTGGANRYFNYSKDEFMERFNNQLAGVGYFIGETTAGTTVVITPASCSFIEICEEEI